MKSANEYIKSIDKMLNEEKLRLKVGHGKFIKDLDAIKRLVNTNTDPNSLIVKGLLSNLEQLQEKLSTEGKPHMQFLGLTRGSRQVASAPPSRRTSLSDESLESEIQKQTPSAPSSPGTKWVRATAQSSQESSPSSEKVEEAKSSPPDLKRQDTSENVNAELKGIMDRIDESVELEVEQKNSENQDVFDEIDKLLDESAGSEKKEVLTEGNFVKDDDAELNEMMENVLEGRAVAMKEEDPNRSQEKSSKKVVSQEQFLKDLGLDEKNTKAERNSTPKTEVAEKREWSRASADATNSGPKANPMIKGLMGARQSRGSVVESNKSEEPKPETPTMGRK